MNNINYIIINGERYNSVISAIYEIESLYEKAETIRDAWISVDIVINGHTVTKSDYMDNMISYLNSLIQHFNHQGEPGGSPPTQEIYYEIR